MKIKRVDHIAIAVEDVRDIVSIWSKVLGFEVEREEMMEENGVKIVVMKINGGGDLIPKIEMIEPYGERSPIRNFLSKKGKGVHHICFETEDIKSDMRELKEKGVKLLSEEPVEGVGGSLIIFIDPREMGGILIELKQQKR